MMPSRLNKALISKRAAALIAPLCLAWLSICADSPQDSGKKGGLAVVAPEDVGWSSAKLEEARAFAEKIKSAAVMALCDGKVFISWGNVAIKNSLHYRTAKPYTRWWWFASEIRKEDIVRQLDWLKAHNFGGVEIAWVYPLNIERYKRFYPWITDEQRKIVEPRQKWQSPEWSEIVAFAKESADKIGLGMDFTFGSAWPFGDSRVPKQDGAKIYGHPEAKQEVIISWEYPQNGLVIDHMSKGAFERYAARMGAALTKATHTGGPSALFCDSWEVDTNGIWTDGFGEAFKKRYGYAIEPYMSARLAPENAGPRYDYMRLVSEYVIENFYKPFTETSHRLNAFSRVQAHGSPTDLITAYATADVPETEALLFEPSFSRIAASAAALSGKKDVTSETFTCAYGFPRDHFKEEQAADLKLIADAVLANGVNHIIWHGTPFSPQYAAHDSEFYASVHVNEKGALAPDLTSFNEYMEKVSAYMNEGRTFSSLAIYMPVEDAWVQGEYPKELQFRWTGTGAYELRYIKPAPETKGYHPLWINGEFLRRAKLENGRLNVGDTSFSSLYVDVDYLDGDALGAILEIAKKGFPVCLKKKPKQPGRAQTALYQEQLEDLAKLPNVSADLKGLAIPKPLVEGRDLPDFWCREKDGECRIFFAQPLAQDLKMPLRYGQSFMDREITRRVTINAGGKSTPLDLVFKPYQSLLVRVDKHGDPSFVDITYLPRPPVVKENFPAAGRVRTPPTTVAASVALPWEVVERSFVALAEAMPADKWGFAPTQGEFKGVRTFAEQVKHVACANFAFFAEIDGQTPPPDCATGGPSPATTKAELMAYLRESLAYADKVLATLNEKNMLDAVDGPYFTPNTKLGVAVAAVWHASDHYGQLVECLRMNGIAPPASQTSPFQGAGIRSSTYGRPNDPGPAYWARTGAEIAAKFPGASPEAIWIVSRLKGRGTEMSFPVPPGVDPLITGMSEDISEPVLELFDKLGYRVWLQTEPGWAPVDQAFHVMLNRYGHHKCVVGVGVDVEWHRSHDPDMGDPVTDELARTWLAAARSHNPSYRMFLKHFREDVMPPTVRDGIMFVDDSQIFKSSDAMIEEFAKWGKTFAPAPVGFQYGYLSDKPWWGLMKDPVKEIGDRILAATPNTEALFWVDFSIQDVFPPDASKGDRVMAK